MLKFNKAMLASDKIFTYTRMVFNVRILFYSRTRRSLGGKVVKKNEKYIFSRATINLKAKIRKGNFEPHSKKKKKQTNQLTVNKWSI